MIMQEKANENSQLVAIDAKFLFDFASQIYLILGNFHGQIHLHLKIIL